MTPAGAMNLSAFLNDATVLCQALEQSLLRLAAGEPDAGALAGVDDGLQTIEAGATTFALEAVLAVVHPLSRVLASWRAGRLAPGRGLMEALLAGVDHVKTLLARQAEFSPTVDGALLSQGQSVLAALVCVLAEGVPVSGQELPAAGGEATPMVRVEARKLDQLINRVGELLMASAGANAMAAEVGAPRLLETTSTVTRLVEAVRDGALNLRMVPIGETFAGFTPVVADTARTLGKDIRLAISGGETELDKAVVEKIGEALMQLLRNAMEHGIETAEVRQARGKPAMGTIQLHAYQDSGGVVLEVSDDGGGLATEALLQRARQQGLLAPHPVPSEGDLLSLMVASGFSTRATPPSAGRGMALVQQRVAALHGSLALENRPGRGCTLRLHLPLSLAIIEGFLVSVGSASFVVPLEQVVECLDLPEPPGADSCRGEYVNQRGQVLPYIPLGHALGLAEEGPPSPSQSLVVVQCAGKRAGLVVDALHGEIQTVIKPLSRIFSRVEGISGSTILGSGVVALIVDVPRLLQQVSERAVEPVAHS